MTTTRIVWRAGVCSTVQVAPPAPGWGTLWYVPVKL